MSGFKLLIIQFKLLQIDFLISFDVFQRSVMMKNVVHSQCVLLLVSLIAVFLVSSSHADEDYPLVLDQYKYCFKNKIHLDEIIQSVSIGAKSLQFICKACMEFRVFRWNGEKSLEQWFHR